MLKIAYSFFVGLLLAIFVGVGINAFYEKPELPDHTTQPVCAEKTQECDIAQKEIDRELKTYEEAMQTYNRNVSIIALVSAVVFVVASLVFERKIRFLSDGIMLGGIFTLIYSIGRSFASSDDKYTFIVVTAGLIIAFTLGYLRFIRGEEKKA